METSEVLISFNNTLIAEGVSEEERIERSDVLLHCIEHAEATVEKIRNNQKPKVYSTMRTRDAYELAIMTLIVGWMIGVLTLGYMQTVR